MELKCAEDLKKLILETCYPIGHIWVSMNSTNPKDIVGGTWVQITDKFLYCTTSSKVTGGSKTHVHNLGRDGGACYRKYANVFYQGETSLAGIMPRQSDDNRFWCTDGNSDYQNTSDPGNKAIGVSLYGKTNSTEILPPYITCYAWYRTA